MAYVINGREDFAVNGVSARTVGLVVDTLAPPPMAQPRYSAYPVGRESDLIIREGDFDDIEYHIAARVIRPESYDNSAIYAYLNGAKTLRIAKLTGKEYRVQRVLGIVPTARLRGIECAYDIGFVLAPFKYAADETAIAVDGTIENPGALPSRPIFTGTAAAGATLTVNGETLTFTAAMQFTVDAERMIVANGNALDTIHTVGLLPMLQPGINTVSTTGIENLRCKVNARWY